MTKNNDKNSGSGWDEEAKEKSGGLNDTAARTLKAARYTSLALKGDGVGLTETAATDIVQSEKFVRAASRGFEKAAEVLPSPAAASKLTNVGGKLLSAIPFISVVGTVMSARDTAAKVTRKFDEGEYVGGSLELSSKLAQGVFGAAAGSVVSEGIRYAAGAIDPRYVPEKSSALQLVEELQQGGKEAYATLREYFTGQSAGAGSSSTAMAQSSSSMPSAVSKDQVKLIPS